jgi:hypothetical protein
LRRVNKKIGKHENVQLEIIDHKDKKKKRKKSFVSFVPLWFQIFRTNFKTTALFLQISQIESTTGGAYEGNQ